jgi:O-antigen ligase
MITERTLLKVVQMLLALTFLTPLVVLPSSFIFPFIVPKILLFRTIVLMMVGVYVALLAIDWEKYRPRLTPLTLVVVAFWLSFVVSTFVGVDWYRSFWDSHERMLGLFTVTHYVLFYLILTATVQKEKDWDTLIRAFLGAGALVMVVGLLQKIQPELLLNNGSSRVSATLGNAIYMSGYGLFLLFMGVLSYLRTASADIVWKVYAGVTGLLGFCGIFLGGTRGTFLGLIAGIGIMLVLGAVVSKQRQIRLGAIGILVAVVALAGVVYAFRGSSFVASIPAVGRIVTTDFAHLRENTRVMAWEVAWDGFVDKPVFGWGPNNYYYTFNTFYRPQFLRYGYQETWFDNAHNIVMNTLATQGVFGIIVYLSIFFFVAYNLVRARKCSNMSDLEAIVLAGFFVGHFVHNVFVFENPTSYLYFFFALAYVCVRSYAQPSRENVKHSKHISAGAGMSIGVCVLLLVYVFNINPGRANTATLHTIQSLYRGEQSTATYDKAFTVPTPHIDDVRSDLARSVGQVVPQMLQQGKRENALELINLAIEDLQKNMLLHPMDIRQQLGIVTLYQQRASITQRIEDIASAEQLAEQALPFSPHRQQLLFMLASLEQQLSKYDEGLQHVLSARDADSQISESWMRVIAAYELAGRHDDALREIADAHDAGIVFSEEEYATIASIQRDK